MIAKIVKCAEVADLRHIVLDPQQFETEIRVGRGRFADGEARMDFGLQKQNRESAFGQNGGQHGAA